MLQSINIALNLSAFILSGMLLIASLLGGTLREKVFRWFFALVLITCLGAPGDTLIMMLAGTPGSEVYAVIRAIDFLNYGAMGITLIAMGMYLYELLSAKRPVPMAFVCVHIVLAGLVTVLVIVAQFFPVLVRLDASNHYHKGSLFWLFELFPLASLVCCAALILASKGVLSRREFISLLLYMLTPMACYLVETAVAGIWLTYFGSAVALFLVYINIQMELKHRLIEKEAELAEGRIAMMISQIQPHFIFNTLSSISEVCEDNPLAQKCLITFSEYLRVNMDSLAQKTPISFEQELEHVRQYLWLERLRFEEKLTVEYDIRVKDFMLPVLTLQPIVENAVRHGITRKASAGTVRISTKRLRQSIHIVVEDDGVGFDMAAPLQGGRSHMGLDNVRARLRELCNGTLTIASDPEQGTVVTISIPDAGRNVE
ncbi:histidine kinase [Eubacteriales bacterium OttesenSCG-928-A19]|nr:histidine kinase [Eubacteriales bacterium OttesenSCG-928-A19]